MYAAGGLAAFPCIGAASAQCRQLIHSRNGGAWSCRVTDDRTLRAYEAGAASFAQDWHRQHAPSDLQSTVKCFFKPGTAADIGCGSGRDVAWLSANGFPAIGYDASQGLLAEARQRYPHCDFRSAALPDLAGIADGTFDNVLCETVIMHLPEQEIDPAVRRLVSILRPGGVLYLTWRITTGADTRDRQGRLYAAFDPAIVRNALAGADILLDKLAVSASSAKAIHRIVACRRE
jgi:SAM-dependent methyltransferase